MCENFVTPPFHFEQLPTQVPKCLYWLQGFESAIIFAHFLGGSTPKKPVGQKKAHKIEAFGLSPF